MTNFNYINNNIPGAFSVRGSQLSPNEGSEGDEVDGISSELEDRGSKKQKDKREERKDESLMDYSAFTEEEESCLFNPWSTNKPDSWEEFHTERRAIKTAYQQRAIENAVKLIAGGKEFKPAKPVQVNLLKKNIMPESRIRTQTAQDLLQNKTSYNHRTETQSNNHTQQNEYNNPYLQERQKGFFEKFDETVGSFLSAFQSQPQHNLAY